MRLPQSLSGLSAILGAVGASVVSGVTVYFVAALAVEIRGEFHFGVARFGALISVYFLCAAIASIPVSTLCDTHDPRVVMEWGCLATGALLFGLAIFVHGWWGLALIMALTGASSAAIQPAANLFLSQNVSWRRQGLAYGAKQAAIPLAVVLAGVSVPSLALTLGWREAICGAAVIAWFAGAWLRWLTPVGASPRHLSKQPSTLDRRERRHLLQLSVGFGLGISSASCLSAFAVTSTVAIGYGQGMGGLLAGLGGIFALASRISVGGALDKVDISPFVLVVYMLGVGVLGFLLLAVSAFGPSLLFVPGLILCFTAGWGWNGAFNYGVVLQYPRKAARATGVTAVGGRVGGVVGPLLFGLVLTGGSYALAWLSTAVIMSIGAYMMSQRGSTRVVALLERLRGPS